MDKKITYIKSKKKENTTTAKIVENHSYWISPENISYEDEHVYCGNCWKGTLKATPICPNCGAIMDVRPSITY